ncbi:MAG: mycothiol synthase [Acidimicrobiia bacterium]|nr:mycothiol synthase [Acidimicrobiia bacterium]
MRRELRDEEGALIALEVEPVSADDRAEADDAGLRLTREILQLRVSLPLAIPPNAPVVTTRPFVPGVDDEALLEVNNRAFAWHPDQSDWSVDDLQARVAEDWFDPEGFRVHEHEGRIVGFCWTKVHPPTDVDPALGEIFVIGVDPDHHGRGLGRALVVDGLAHLAGRGLRTGMLHVEHDNTAARRLYRSLGFTEHSAHCWWRADDTSRS